MSLREGVVMLFPVGKLRDDSALKKEAYKVVEVYFPPLSPGSAICVPETQSSPSCMAHLPLADKQWHTSHGFGLLAIDTGFGATFKTL